ncbi:MAG: type 1 glutamine amidotransferase [Hydrocarboniphaga sp.]|uniref:type 1 glutamine amidotransferase n=1 Tax=Hydrocarboniphaga sp. TaxID=2033016 RepID=UPI002622BFD8|nr:type 1 glutamine amidotransferase [Hydrocarboniphaga sp.]MDB5972286.1 type 1 glutamine amidotransferase [Hydrocarboniphaga sp.]
MRVHWLQHAPEDDLGCIAPWLAARGHTVTRSGLYEGDALPSLAEFDALLVMGGAMNVDEEGAHPWLVDEKRFLRSVLSGGQRVLGICLGAQLIAEQLGAKVLRNAHREIGWFDVELSDAGRAFAPMSGWPASLPLFHWHGYRFELPPAATRLAFSAACDQQAFAFDDGRVIGLQFHPEVTSAGVRLWLEQGHPRPGPHVQPVERMREDLSRFAHANTLLCGLLEQWLSDRR